jgi:8-oxo-dGTP diphosphatase
MVRSGSSDAETAGDLGAADLRQEVSRTVDEDMRHYSVSASAVVIREDRRFLAVQRRDTGAWVLPGGVVEPGEPIRDAAGEVLEESGVIVELERLSGIYQNLATNVVSFVFVAAPRIVAASTATAEADCIGWLTADEALDLMSEPFADRVRDAYADNALALRTFTAERIMTPKDAIG